LIAKYTDTVGNVDLTIHVNENAWSRLTSKDGLSGWKVIDNMLYEWSEDLGDWIITLIDDVVVYVIGPS